MAHAEDVVGNAEDMASASTKSRSRYLKQRLFHHNR